MPRASSQSVRDLLLARMVVDLPSVQCVVGPREGTRQESRSTVGRTGIAQMTTVAGFGPVRRQGSPCLTALNPAVFRLHLSSSSPPQSTDSILYPYIPLPLCRGRWLTTGLFPTPSSTLCALFICCWFLTKPSLHCITFFGWIVLPLKTSQSFLYRAHREHYAQELCNFYHINPQFPHSSAAGVPGPLT